MNNLYIMETEKYYGLNEPDKTTTIDSSNIDYNIPGQTTENPSLNTTNASILYKASATSNYIKQDNCKHCKNFTPTITKVAKEYKVTIYYINLTKLTEAEYNKFKEEGTFTGTPTVLFYEDGEELGSFSRLVGNKSEKTLINRLTARGYINE